MNCRPPDPEPGECGASRHTNDAPLNLIVGSLKRTAARYRVPEGQENITLRAAGLWRVVPGEIVTVQPRKGWTCAKHEYVSGDITASRSGAKRWPWDRGRLLSAYRPPLALGHAIATWTTRPASPCCGTVRRLARPIPAPKWGG